MILTLDRLKEIVAGCYVYQNAGDHNEVSFDDLKLLRDLGPYLEEGGSV